MSRRERPTSERRDVSRVSTDDVHPTWRGRRPLPLGQGRRSRCEARARAHRVGGQAGRRAGIALA